MPAGLGAPAEKGASSPPPIEHEHDYEYDNAPLELRRGRSGYPLSRFSGPRYLAVRPDGRGLKPGWLDSRWAGQATRAEGGNWHSQGLVYFAHSSQTAPLCLTDPSG